MSMARGLTRLLDKLGTTGAILYAVRFDLPTMPDWCDGTDVLGHSVLLVGRHLLGETDDAHTRIAEVLDALKHNELPDGVLTVSYHRPASLCAAEAIAGTSAQVLAYGGRGSGKTFVTVGIQMALAELHARAGYALPLRTQWLHDSLTNAEAKSGETVKEFGGAWSLGNDNREAVFTLANTKLCVARFIGCNDATSAELLRASSHVIVAEELLSTFTDGGIDPEAYDLARSSMIGRLKTRRRVAIANTNPGDPDTWVGKRFLFPGSPGCAAFDVPSTARLSPAEMQELLNTYADSPELQKRLALGQWIAMPLGEVVASGFFRERHVADKPLRPVPGHPFILGMDGGLTPCTIVAQHIEGELRVYASLASLRAGTRQHVENEVLPWMASYAPWMVGSRMIPMSVFCDPAMQTPDQSNLESSPVSVVRQVLQCTVELGPQSWPGRRDPLLAMLTQMSARTGRARMQLDAHGCALLVRALESGWCYRMAHGVVSKDLPMKNHPHSDLGDALAYLIAGLSEVMPMVARPIKVESRFGLTLGPGASHRQKGFPWS